MQMSKRSAHNIKQRSQNGFTLIELMIAITVLVIGVVAVAQLIPAAMLLNTRNRADSSSLVYAQREMDQFVNYALTAPAPYTFTDQQGNANLNLGGATSFNAVVGNPVTTVAGHVAVDFSGAQVNGYGYYYTDQRDTSGTTYDVRWAVINTGTANNVNSRRFILGVRKMGGNGFMAPVTLDTTVSR
jgi:prepilin-type N-terminal cleavage/methylation domain-containing protein